MATHTINQGLAASAPSGDVATYTSLCVAMADFLGIGRNTEGTGNEWDTADEHRLSEVINSGYWQFLYPPILQNESTAHRWLFMRPDYPFSTVASTYLYDMPADFGAIAADIHYATNSDDSRVIRQVSPGIIDRERSKNSVSGRPAYFAMRPKSVAETSRQVTEMMLFPTPDAAYALVAYYDVSPVRLSGTYPYPLGGQPHSATILQSCRDIAAQWYKEQPAGPEHELFMQRLQASVEYDRRHSPAFLGYNNDGAGGKCITRHGGDFKCTLRHNLGGG